MEIELEEEYLTASKDKFGFGRAAGGKLSSMLHTSSSDTDTYTCHCFVKQKDALFAGRSDGQIIAWRQNKAHSELKDVAMKGHKGRIHCILYIPTLTSGILFTGSAGIHDV